MPEKKTKINASNVRKKLIRSAKQLFAKKEFSAVSIREIASNARVNSAGISYHFGNKLGLYKSILEESLHSTLGKIKPIENAPLSPNQKLIEFQKIIISILKDDPEINLLIHRTMISTMNKRVKRLLNEIYIEPLTKQLRAIVSSCTLDRKLDFISGKKIIFSIIAIPTYWSLFQSGYKDMFTNPKGKDDLMGDVFTFSSDILAFFLESGNK